MKTCDNSIIRQVYIRYFLVRKRTLLVSRDFAHKGHRKQFNEKKSKGRSRKRWSDTIEKYLKKWTWKNFTTV